MVAAIDTALCKTKQTADTISVKVEPLSVLG
jgi:hypothetical protein